MIQLLGIAGYTKVVAVASPRHNDLLRGWGAAHVVDYRSPSFAEDVSKAVGGEHKIKIVVDCVSLDESFAAISKVVAPGARVAFLSPIKKGGDLTGKGSAFLTEAPKEIVEIFPEGVNIMPIGTFYFDQVCTFFTRQWIAGLIHPLERTGCKCPHAYHHPSSP
jgi:NADPH:quinone reductase-like Zn-dependent oxidoreductase